MTTMTGTAAAVQPQSDEIVAEEHWARKGDVELAMYRKYAPGAAQDGARHVLFLVHGSSASARTSYDLDAGEHGEYSVMNVFARQGYDVWTMDHEGYGRSSRTDGFSTIMDGVEDLKAAVPVVEKATGQSRLAMFGTSSGALRAGAFCNACPERIERLALSAFPWTGKDAPSLIKRRERLAEWQATNTRRVDATFYQGMLTRDIVGLTIPELAEIVAAAEMRNGGGNVPNGTYVDMCINLPMVDPAKIACPVLMIRSEHDGITTNEDTLAFFDALATKDKQLVTMSGQAHNVTFGV
ncbi:MAG TPA: alpha/beta hydrolase, partial [Afifellaceae bacterium]|nr:alpha/beta hydrolase [Afifellaceae bacterium]